MGPRPFTSWSTPTLRTSRKLKLIANANASATVTAATTATTNAPFSPPPPPTQVLYVNLCFHTATWAFPAAKGLDEVRLVFLFVHVYV